MRISMIAVLLASMLGSPSAAWAGAPSQSVGLKRAVAPVYPPIAITANVSGDVKVVVTLDKAGSVTKVRIVSGNPLLRRAAMEAAKRWRFKPGADRRHVHLFFLFQMVPRGTPAKEITPVFTPPYRVEVRAMLPRSTVNYGRAGGADR